MRPYPLIFEPVLRPRVWGGQSLARFGKTLPPGEAIGESWELSDFEAARSLIANGPLRGEALDGARRAWGGSALGVAGDFPLLLKYLDARQNLSVQTHPAVGKEAKHEAWFIVHAEENAVIYKGFRPGVTRAEVERCAGSESMVGLLERVPARAGECHVIPGGTCHAIGGGVVIAEVQTPSDTTYRLYDWGRAGREMHAAQALACLKVEPAPPAASLPAGAERGVLARTPHFSIEHRRLRAGETAPLGFGCSVLMIIAGAGEIVAVDGSFEPVQASLGATVLIPAAIAGVACFRARPAGEVLVVTPGDQRP